MKETTQNIDAGGKQRSPAPDEPHREHEVRDRGGVYAREQETQRPQPQRLEREVAEQGLPPPSDPDDPASP